ncbi:MAG: RNA 2',3'-cyclic phosphodiesterase [Jiangellaceae bacterium]
MRLFAAGVPPANVVRHLDRAVAPLRDDVLRWAALDSWHLTLAFYGEVDPDAVPELTRRLTRAAARSMPMALRLAAAGRFGRGVLWMGVLGDTGPLRRLAASAAAAGRRLGVEVEEGHGYRPHITLARSASRIDLRPYVEPLKD